VISTPERERAGECVSVCSNHLDVVPTLLALGNVSGDMPDRESARFERIPDLPGRDLLNDKGSKPSYFVTHDHILEGKSRKAAFGRRFPWVGAVWPMRYQPLDARNTSVEAVVDDLPGSDGQTLRWKLIRYFDPTARAHRASDEWSLFCLSEDPCELDERVEHPDCKAIVDVLRTRLLACGAHQ
jgi:arylsulfatase A-like enzyme